MKKKVNFLKLVSFNLNRFKMHIIFIEKDVESLFQFICDEIYSLASSIPFNEHFFLEQNLLFFVNTKAVDSVKCSIRSYWYT